MVRTFLLAGAALAAIAGVAIAQPSASPERPGPGGFMRQMDANTDGTITRAEFDTARTAHFTARDANGDGALSGEELRRQRGGERPEGGPRRERPNIDANNDGVISREEFLAGPTARFDRLDANNDGRLTDAEKPNMRRMHGFHHRGGGMRGADADRNGSVTRAEFDAQGAAMFTRMDANSDGQLTAADREARRAQREQQRQ